jgi:hypothetical protein
MTTPPQEPSPPSPSGQWPPSAPPQVPAPPPGPPQLPTLPPWATVPPAAGVPPAPPPAPPSPPWVTRRELRAAGLAVLALVLVGVLAGLLWQAWTVRTQGFDIGSGVIVPDETEGWIGADAHFAIITGIVGVAAGLLAWRWRTVRGPAMVAALAVGGVLGSLVAGWVGHLTGGGNHTVVADTNLVKQLPLSVHMTGLFLVQAIAALVVYLVAALVSASDDLGVSSGVPAPAPVSAGAEYRPDDARWHGYGPGGAQQGDLAAQ